MVFSKHLYRGKGKHPPFEIEHRTSEIRSLSGETLHLSMVRSVCEPIFPNPSGTHYATPPHCMWVTSRWATYIVLSFQRIKQTSQTHSLLSRFLPRDRTHYTWHLAVMSSISNFLYCYTQLCSDNLIVAKHWKGFKKVQWSNNFVDNRITWIGLQSNSVGCARNNTCVPVYNWTTQHVTWRPPTMEHLLPHIRVSTVITKWNNRLQTRKRASFERRQKVLSST